MTLRVDAYWSFQSPYCYFSLDRLLALDKRADVDVVSRLVLPGVLRDPGVFADRGAIEQDYFLRDVARTAEFLGLPYAEADPYPVEFMPGSMYRAAEQQPRVYALYHLSAAAVELGYGWAFLDRAARLIWDGSTRDWHQGTHLQRAAEQAGLDYGTLCTRAEEGRKRFDVELAANRAAMLEAGHWGVPLFVVDGEPFYGQDRFDQLLWRIAAKRERPE